MPAFITHYLYGVDLYKNLSSTSLKQIIHTHIGAYRLGLQGPDIFFYNPLCMIQQKERNIGSQMHETNVSCFFRNYLRIMKTLTPDASETALAYFCGLIAHNTLDSYIHPYVYYRAGFHPDSKIAGKYYFGMHQEIETCMDFLLLHREKNMPPSQFHTSKIVHLPPSQLRLLSYVLSHTLKKTYPDMNYVGTSFLGIHLAFFSIKAATTVLHSNHGRRKKFLHGLENRLLGYHLVATNINWDGMTDRYDAMNHSRKLWKNPWNPDVVSTQTVEELYEQAKERYLSIIPLLEDFYQCTRHEIRTKEKPLLKELGNFSYHSGFPCK